MLRLYTLASLGLFFHFFFFFSMSEANVGPLNSQRLLEHLAVVEGVAEDILADKQKLIDLDRHRNQTREAVR